MEEHDTCKQVWGTQEGRRALNCACEERPGAAVPSSLVRLADNVISIHRVVQILLWRTLGRLSAIFPCYYMLQLKVIFWKRLF